MNSEKKKITSFLFILFLGMIHVGFDNNSTKKEEEKISKPTPHPEKRSYPFAIGHRGMCMTFPENTLSGFKACVVEGMGIEFDIRTSQDGVMVILHDDNVDRTTNGGAYRVRDLTLSQIKTLDAGSWFDPSFAGEKIPTLEELLAMVKEKQSEPVHLAVNIKDIDQDGEREMVALLKQYGLIEQAFCFDQPQTMTQRLKGSVKIAKNVSRDNLQQELNEGWTDVFLIGFVPTNAEVELLRQNKKGIVVNIAGPRANDNNPASWRSYLTAGIDGIIVDYVEEFNSYINNLFQQ